MRALVTVTVNALPATPTISAGGPTTFCTGGSVVLTSSSATGNLWSNSLNTPSITVTTSGNYTVTVTDANTCSATSSAINVNVSNAPSPTINASATQSCSGDSVTITSSAADSYLWSNGASTQSITIYATETVSVTTTNANACNGVGASNQITVTFNQTPTAAATYSVSGNVVTFTNSSSNATSYSWDFGDFTNSSASAPTHAYAGNDTYTVVLSAINGNCSDEVTLEILINVSLNELTNNLSMVVYPNPADQSAVLAIESTLTGTGIVEVVNTLGQSVFMSDVTLSGNTFINLPVSQLSNGLYMVRLTTSKGYKTIRLQVTK
jgi:hypothetical protein